MNAILNIMGRTEIRRAILRHFREHPDAADTTQGIAQWWSDDTSIQFWQQDVEAVVAELVSEGILKKNSRGDRTTYSHDRKGKHKT